MIHIFKNNYLAKSLLFISCLSVLMCFQTLSIHAINEIVNQQHIFNSTIAYSITAFISLILLLGYLCFVNKRNTLFILLYSSVFIINIGYTFGSASTTISEALLANKLSYLGAVFLPLFMLIIIASECKIYFSKPVLLAFIIISLSVFILAASPGYSNLYYKGVELVITEHGSFLVKDYGELHIVYYLYLASYYLITLVSILYSYFIKKSNHSSITLHLLVCLSCNIVVWYLGQLFHFEFEFLSISYIVSEIYLLSIYNLLEEYNVTAEPVIEPTNALTIEQVNANQNDTILDSDLSSHIEEIIRTWPQVALLTTRELDVFKLLILNKKRKDIAEELCISENTVKKHTSNIFSKLNVSNRTEIITTISKTKK